jgi:hypothetical protein
MQATGSRDYPANPFMYRYGLGIRRLRSALFYMSKCGVLGTGPNFRRDTAARDPDVVDEAFRQYAIDWGISRVGRLFREQGLPLSIALNALFPQEHSAVWKQFRSLVPKAPIIAHGVNNSTELLPLGRDLEAQKAYIRRTLDLIEKDTGVRPGMDSPSVYPNADTLRPRAPKASATPSTQWIPTSSLALPAGFKEQPAAADLHVTPRSPVALR